MRHPNYDTNQGDAKNEEDDHDLGQNAIVWSQIALKYIQFLQTSIFDKSINQFAYLSLPSEQRHHQHVPSRDASGDQNRPTVVAAKNCKFLIKIFNTG